MIEFNGNKQNTITAALCLLAIGVSGFWIYRTQFASPPLNEPLHKGIGQVMAEQTAHLLNSGQIVLLTMETRKAPELAYQLEAFEQTLKNFPAIKIKQNVVLETEGRDKYGVGSGLSSRRFLRLVKKYQNAGAIVSFVGAPHLSDEDLAQIGPQPKFIAESRSSDKLKKLFESNVLHAAVVSRFEFPGPNLPRPRTPADWFSKRYQVVTAQNAAALP